MIFKGFDSKVKRVVPDPSNLLLMRQACVELNGLLTWKNRGHWMAVVEREVRSSKICL